mmetsp:Transcript_1593/g.2117  ORF Transcript_1593/g.2117 Transcript_1593/m.2117 type:complete len:97 (+) Transcript_1593:195-485(+)
MIQASILQAKTNQGKVQSTLVGSVAVSDQLMHFSNDAQFVSKCIPEFIPIAKSDSGIIDDAGIRLISFNLPAHIRTREWSKLFSIDNDGSSFNTFY